MNISTAQDAPVQKAFQMAGAVQAGVAPVPQPAAQGDTVTISEQGKALAKASTEKGGGDSSPPIKIAVPGQTAAAGKATLASALQSARGKQNSPQADVASTKAQVSAFS